MLPAELVVLTEAAIVVSLSAARSEPGTLILKLPEASTVAVKVCPLTTRLTVSPVWVPVVEPVIVTLPPASATLRTLSSVTSFKVIVGAGAAPLTVKGLLPVPVPVLPAASVLLTEAAIVVSLSATRSEPGTLMLKLPEASTVPVYVLPLTTRLTVSPA